jgi:hypothetical protein
MELTYQRQIAKAGSSLKIPKTLQKFSDVAERTLYSTPPELP